MRLGSPLPRTWDSPAGWVAALRAVASAPPTGRWTTTPTRTSVDAYADAAAAADIVIAEIGAWSNPLSPDDADARRRARALQARGSRSPTAWARAAASTSPARARDTWDGPHPDNLSRDTFALIVDTRARDHRRGRAAAHLTTRSSRCRGACPTRPTATSSCWSAIDRPQLRRPPRPGEPDQQPGQVLRQRRLPARVLREARPAHPLLPRQGHHARQRADGPPRRGDPRAAARSTTACCSREMDRLDPDTPILVEHLTTDEEYAAAVAHIRSVAEHPRPADLIRLMPSRARSRSARRTRATSRAGARGA